MTQEERWMMQKVSGLNFEMVAETIFEKKQWYLIQV